VVPGGTVVSHIGAANVEPKEDLTEAELFSVGAHVSVFPVTKGHIGACTWDQEKATYASRRKRVGSAVGHIGAANVGPKRGIAETKSGLTDVRNAPRGNN